jgi:hypothetical protein
MKLAAALAIASLTSHSLHAQRISLGAQTGSAGVVLRTVLNGSPHQTTLPPLTTLPAPWLLFDSQSWSGGGFGAEGSADRTVSMAGHALARFQVRASGGVIDPATSGSSQATVDVLFAFGSLRPHVGTVVLRYHSNDTGTGSVAVDVDVGQDGIDFRGGPNQAPVEVRLPAVIGPGGLVVQVVGTANASITGRGNAGHAGFLELEFVPRVTAVPYGDPCTFVLDADTGSTATTDTFAFQVHSAPALAVALLALGAAPLSVPIPPSQCLLRVDPLVFVILPLDASGRGSVEFTLPHASGLSAFVQGLIPQLGTSGWSWQTSNGQQVAAQ